MDSHGQPRRKKVSKSLKYMIDMLILEGDPNTRIAGYSDGTIQLERSPGIGRSQFYHHPHQHLYEHHHAQSSSSNHSSSRHHSSSDHNSPSYQHSSLPADKDNRTGSEKSHRDMRYDKENRGKLYPDNKDNRDRSHGDKGHSAPPSYHTLPHYGSGPPPNYSSLSIAAQREAEKETRKH